MDGLNNMAAAAAQAVWGDKYGSTEEPISGLKGDVSKGEPFDAGNIGKQIDHVTATNLRNNSSGEASTSTATTDEMNSTGLQPTTATGTTSRGYGNTGVPKELHSSRVDSDRDDRAARVGASLDATTTGSSGLGSSTAADVVAGATDGISGTSGTQTGAQTGATGTNTGMTGVNATSANPISTSGPVDRVAGAGVFGHASHVQDLSVTAGDSTAQQNDTRDPADPSTHPANAAPMKNVDNTTGGLDTGDNPVKVDGPGPKPVAILARERGGDAGNVNADASGADLGEPQIGAPGAGSDAAAGQIQHEGGHAKDPAEGEYVKSTGLAADGGDFDATRPGAGAEADRLMEEKGMHVGGSNKVNESDPVADANQSTGKPKLTERIKAKFHKH